MKRTYRIHPADYAIGDSERLYERMAAKGWVLEKRGTALSRFRREAPQRLRYRIELAQPEFLEGADLPEEQRELYEDCGWHLAAHCGVTYVFCAQEDGDAPPELYTDPRGQVQMLRSLRRTYRWGWLWAFLLVALLFFMVWVTNDGDFPRAVQDFAAQWRLSWTAGTSIVLLYLVLLAEIFYSGIYGWARTAALTRRLQRGLPIDRSDHRAGRIAHGAVRGALGLAIAVLAVLSVAQYAGTKTYEMPAEADGPYLTIADLGHEGTRTEMLTGVSPAKVEVTRSLLATVYNTHECVETADGDTIWIYQDVYCLDSPEQARALLPALMETATFGRPESFEPVWVEGLDEAYWDGMDSVAQKGSLAYSITVNYYSTADGEAYDVLRALGAADFSAWQ